MIALDAGAHRKVRRAGEHEIEALVRAKRARLPEIGVADVVPIGQSVVGSRFPRQPDAFFLRFNR